MGHFLLHRPVARRPGCARSAARGISTGVTSRRTGGRAVDGGQPVPIGFRFPAVRLGFRRSQAAHRPLWLKPTITKRASVVNPTVGRIVVEHRDRLARFGFEMVEAALYASGKRIVVVEEGEVKDDLVRDLLEILTSACGRLYGRRSARNRAKRALEVMGCG
jgi:hypothetical protein